MENQTNSKSIILTNGLYLGIIGSIAHLALWASGQLLELNWVNSLIYFLGLIIFIILGLKAFKATSGGFMSWVQGLKIGMGIAMVSAVISVIYTLLFMNVIDPDFSQKTMEFQQQAWMDAGLTEEQIEAFTESSKSFQSPVMISSLLLGMTAFFGFVISAIAAAIMKKSEEETY